jgi:hypothetical protein
VSLSVPLLSLSLSLVIRLPGLSLWSYGLDPMSVHVRFVVDKVALGHVSLEYFCFPLSVSFHQRSTLIFIYMLLFQKDVQTGEAWEPSKKQCSWEIGEHRVRKVLSLFFVLKGLMDLSGEHPGQ